MKKNLFFLCALICSMSLFTACGDDDEDTTWQNIPDSTKENTTLKINGVNLPDASASLDVQSAEAGLLTLTKAVYGHDKIDVPVKMTKSNDSTYVYEGTANIDGAIAKSTAAVDKGLTITAKGTVTASGKLTAEVTTSGWGTLSGVYSGDSLKLTLDGNALTGTYYTISVEALSEEKVTLSLGNTIYNYKDFKLETTLTKDGEGYKLEGSAEANPGLTISATGTWIKNVLTLAVATSGYTTLNGYHSVAFGNMEYSYNGVVSEEESSGSADVTFTSETSFDLKLSYIIPGIFLTDGDRKGSFVLFKNIKAVKGSELDTYTFNATLNPTGYKASTVSIEGTINRKKLTIEINHVIKSSIVGIWNMSATNNLGKVFLDYQSVNNSATIPQILYDMIPEEMKNQIPQTMNDKTFNQVILGLLSKYTAQLKSIEFTDGGNIIIKYVKIGDVADKVSTLEGYINYTIDDNGKLRIAPNLAKLISMVMPTSATTLKSYDPYDATNLLNGEGIPLKYTVNGSELLITLDNGVLTGLSTFAGDMIEFVKIFIKDEALLKKIQDTYNSINEFITNSTKLEVGLYLNK